MLKPGNRKSTHIPILPQLHNCFVNKLGIDFCKAIIGAHIPLRHLAGFCVDFYRARKLPFSKDNNSLIYFLHPLQTRKRKLLSKLLLHDALGCLAEPGIGEVGGLHLLVEHARLSAFPQKSLLLQDRSHPGQQQNNRSCYEA
ncbi:hypothetical protein D3C85_1394930 [compost metagenome]